MGNQIKKFPVPLIFKKILKEHLSGELIVFGEEYTRHLYFISGRLAFATSDNSQERLGDYLLAIGKITEEQLDNVLKIKNSLAYKDRKLGEILVKFAKLDKRDYYYALKNLIRQIAVHTFSLKDGEWRFIVKTPKVPNPHSFKIKLPDIIYEGVNNMNDFSYFKRKFYYRAPVTTAISETIFGFLSSEEIRIFTQLSSMANTTIEQILKNKIFPGDSKDIEKKFWKRLIILYLLNVLDFVEFTVDVKQNKNIEEINDMYSRINAKEMNYYQLLGIDSNSPISEVKKSYFDFSRKYHPDRINAAPDSTVMLKANAVFAEINRAFETLSNNNKKREYDALGFKDKDEISNTTVEKSKNVRNLYLKANKLYKQKLFFEAVTLLEQVVALDDKRANYFLLLGLAQSKLPTMVNQAVSNLNKACAIEPWNADPVFALGEVYRSQNMLKKAEHYFQKALEINMEHTLAGKAITDLERLMRPSKKKFSLFGKKK